MGAIGGAPDTRAGSGSDMEVSVIVRASVQRVKVCLTASAALSSARVSDAYDATPVRGAADEIGEAQTLVLLTGVTGSWTRVVSTARH